MQEGNPAPGAAGRREGKGRRGGNSRRSTREALWDEQEGAEEAGDFREGEEEDTEDRVTEKVDVFSFGVSRVNEALGRDAHLHSATAHAREKASGGCAPCVLR